MDAEAAEACPPPPKSPAIFPAFTSGIRLLAMKYTVSPMAARAKRVSRFSITMNRRTRSENSFTYSGTVSLATTMSTPSMV